MLERRRAANHAEHGGEPLLAILEPDEHAAKHEARLAARRRHDDEADGIKRRAAEQHRTRAKLVAKRPREWRSRAPYEIEERDGKREHLAADMQIARHGRR